MPAQATPLTLYRTDIPAAWVDYNGHMNDACYCIAFSLAVDALIEALGIDADYRAQQQCSVYTLENHVCYLQQAHEDESIVVRGQLLQRDGKRLRMFFRLQRAADAVVLATSEQMLMHVNVREGRAAPFRASVWERVEHLRAAHAALPLPVRAGRGIRQLKS